MFPEGKEIPGAGDELRSTDHDQPESPDESLGGDAAEAIDAETIKREDVDKVLSELIKKSLALAENNNASPDEKDKFLATIKRLRGNLSSFGSASRRESARADVRQRMIEELGSDGEIKMKRFIDSLSPHEGIFIQAVLSGGVADMSDAFHGILTVENIYPLVEKDGNGLAAAYRRMSKRVDPDKLSGWKDEWYPVASVLLAKAKEVKE